VTTRLMERATVSQQPDPRTPYPRVAETLRTLRIKARLTQEQAAPIMGLTLSGYRTYEQGKRDLSFRQIEKFSQAFGVPVSTIASMLWPDDPALAKRRQASDWTTLQDQVDSLPPIQRERVIHNYRQIAELALASGMWDIRAELRAAGLSDAEIEQYADEYEGEPIADQIAVVKSILRQREQQAKTPRHQRTESA